MTKEERNSVIDEVLLKLDGIMEKSCNDHTPYWEYVVLVVHIIIMKNYQMQKK